MDIFQKILKGGHIPSDTPGFDKVAKIIAQNVDFEQDYNYHPHTDKEHHQILEQITHQQIDPSTKVTVPFHTDFGPHIFFGKHCFINKNSMFVDLGGIYFGDNVLVGPNVTFASLNHTLDPSHRWEINSAAVHIGDNVWIGASVTILPGVTVGKNAVIGAGAVVTKDIPANTVAVGNPAHVIKYIKNKEIYNMADKKEQVIKHIISLEKQALDKYYAGDMSGYYDIWSHDDFSYFDAAHDKRIDSFAEVKAFLDSKVAGKMHADSYRFVSPRVQLHSNTAILTYQLFADTNFINMKYNVIEVFQLNSDGNWKVVHSTWDTIAPYSRDLSQDKKTDVTV